MDFFLGLEYNATDLASALEEQVDANLKARQDQQYSKIIEDLEKGIAKAEGERKAQLVERSGFFKGIDYLSESLSDRQSQNKLVGLIFKPQNDTNFSIHVIFFDSRFVFENFVFPNTVTSMALEIQGMPFGLPIGQSITQTDLEGLKFQYWEFGENQETDKGISLVFFGEGELRLILAGTSDVKISGSSSNYGYSAFGETENKTFPTLKMETILRINSDDEVPNMAIGLPCPSLWGNEEFITRTLMDYV